MTHLEVPLPEHNRCNIVNTGANDIQQSESNKQSQEFKLPLDKVRLSFCTTFPKFSDDFLHIALSADLTLYVVLFASSRENVSK